MNIINIFQYLYDTKGKKIPFEFKLLNNLLTQDELIYNGDLYLWFSKIKSLPDKLTINGNLELYDSKIKVLPNNLIVNGILDIRYSKISELPDDLYVGSDLWCEGTPLTERIKNDVSLLIKYSKQIKGKLSYDWYI